MLELLRSNMVVVPAYGLAMLFLGFVIIREYRRAQRRPPRILNGTRPPEDR